MINQRQSCQRKLLFKDTLTHTPTKALTKNDPFRQFTNSRANEFKEILTASSAG